MAEAYGVIAPYAMGAGRIQKVLSQAGVKLGGRILAAEQIRQCNHELADAGICERHAGEGLRAMPRWALQLTREAHAAHRLRPIMTAFRSVQGRSWYYDPQEKEMLFRCHVVAGDFNRLEELIGGVLTADHWRLLAEPVATDILEALPKRHLENALSGCLRHVHDTAAPSAPVIEACQALSAEPHVHAPEIAFIRLLQGRFEEAEAVFDALPPTARATKPATTGLAATRALIATLRTDYDAAQRHLDAALVAEKAGTRKRLVFPNMPAFALSLLSLVRIDSPASHAQLDQLVHTANRLNVESGSELAFVTKAARILSGHPAVVGTQYAPRLDVLLEGILTCWADNFAAIPVDDWLRAMLDYRARAAANGFAWIVAECDSTLRRYAETYGDWEDIANLADSEPLHDKLGTKSLAVSVAPVPEWEQSLRALEQLAYEANRKSGGKRDVHAAKRRLVWELDDEYDIELTAREQRQNKNGSWSKGRKVALKRLATEAAGMDFLLPQDRDAAGKISAEYAWSGGMRYELGESGMFALAGHPHVFNANGEPVEIVRREPGLFVDEATDGSAVVTIEPRGWETDEYGVRSVSDRRYEVTRFTTDHQQLFEVIPEEGLVLPANGKARLLEAVSALASQVRVHSATTDGAATAAQVDADAEPWVRLEPADAGLIAALVVEPIADSGICFPPGEGGVTVFASRNGQSVQARRDLAAEQNAETHLLERCGWLAARPTEYEPMMLSDSVQCLELLEQLESAGARCKWPQGEPFRIVARKSTSSLALTVKSADEWMQASGKLVVDDQRVLDLKRLFALLEASPNSRFLELGNGEFLALTKAFRQQLDHFASLSVPAAGGDIRLHPLAALGLEEMIEGAELDADDGWRELRGNLQAAQSFEPDLPSTLQAELRPYQRDGYNWLARLSRWGAGACLADDMGLGKTVQTLALLLDRAPDGPALVVAPTSVTANWIDEARRFAPTLNVKAYTGVATSRASLLDDDPAPFDLYVTTYGVLQNDIDQLAAVEWHSAVLDEAQAIKNPTTKRARAARRLKAKFRLVTTGTPIQNNLMDLFSLYSFLNPGLLGSQEQFRRNFGFPVERDGDMDAQARLRRIIAPFILRRLKTEVLDDLPERTEITLHVEMSPQETALYEVLRQRALEELQAASAEDPSVREGPRRLQLLAHLTRLRLACCNPRLVIDSDAAAPASSKLETFARTLEELLQNRHKVLVFSQFVMHLKLVEEHLNKSGVAYQYLDGGTPAGARAQRIAAFQAGQGDVFLISLKAGGIGLNLTAADYVIHMDPWWNPAVEDQASDRAHRIGQTRPVTIYRLVTEGTIEEQIVDLHHRKRDLADQLLEGADAAGRLNADELLDLLRQPLAAG